MTQIEPNLLNATMFQPAIPPRRMDAHKGSNGSVAIIGGDTGMVGAVLLAARAALFSGAGRVYASMLCKHAPGVDASHPELMLRSVSDLDCLAQLDCVAIGPGLGQSTAAVEVLENWLLQQKTLVLDADALNLIAAHEHLALLTKNRHAATIMTPHAGEAARLLSIGVDAIQSNRIHSALDLAKSLQVTCVLKGAGTIIALQDGCYFINTTGNPALSTGGTGDVLTGVIASLVAQGLASQDAAKLAVFAHGAAADNLVLRGMGPIGVTASDIALEIRNVINQLNATANFSAMN